ncbi:hypothetical protein BDN72DRAFT_892091 [Pluteus cervinus]|uniref:Uncharacterized protein n=1 Tax=Pluteus cervinus TaxID=181527 RepID=A0ACD3BBQ1_9AGAR|nr:hypothetical protein BDN72DRAFT_892091 [Pluteus cervinus]
MQQLELAPTPISVLQRNMASTLVPVMPVMDPAVDVPSHRTWNDQSPIHRLPSEIFTLIFLYAQYAVFPGEKGHMALALSWVCHYWRVVALSSQDLWGIIDFMDLDLVREFLARSGVSILSFYLGAPPGSLDLIVPLILANLPRVQVLQLERTDHNSRFLQIDENWAHSTPHMIELSLSKFLIPERHFNTTAPGLRYLKLEACSFKVTGLRGLNLVELSLVNPKEANTPEEMLAELQNVPELEKLVLEGVLLEGIAPLSERIHFPRLRHLNLGGLACHTLLCFLNNISFPKDTDITINVRSTTTMSSVITGLQNCMGGDQWKLLKAVVCCDQLLGSISCQMTRLVHSGDLKSTNSSITFAWERSENIPGAQEVNRLLTSFDISLLLHLELSTYDDTPLPIDIWDGLFASAFGLQDLMLYGPYAGSFIKAFTLSNDPLVNIGDLTNPTALIPVQFQSLKFPLLKTLKLQRVTDQWSEGAGLWPEDPAVFATLMQYRKVLGMNLSEMIAVGYDLPLAFFQSMDQCVDSFRYYREWSRSVEHN